MNIVAQLVKKYRVLKVRPLNPIVVQPSANHSLSPCFLKTHFKIILPSTPKYFQLLLKFPD